MADVKRCSVHDAPLLSFQMKNECDIFGSDHYIQYCPAVGCTEFSVYPKGRMHPANYGVWAFVGIHVLGKQLSESDGK